MKSNVPWSIKGIDPDARVAAKRAAKEAGMTLGEWLNKQIMTFDNEPEEQTGESAPAMAQGENVQSLPSNVVTVDQLRELVYSLNRLNERLKTSERDSRQALSGLNQGLSTAMERLKEVEGVHRNSTDEAVLERLERIEAARNAENENERIDNLLNLEKALTHMVDQFDAHQRETISRVHASEQAIDDLTGRVSSLDTQMASTINDLKKNIEDVTGQVRQTEKTARAVMLEARAASRSTDDEFIERTGNKLRILGTEIKRSGDHIQALEEQIGKLSGRIEGAEQRSAEGINKVSSTIDALRSDLSNYDTSHSDISKDAQGVISSVTQEADARISSLQDSFDKMVARIEGVVETKDLTPPPASPPAPSARPETPLPLASTESEEEILLEDDSDTVLDELFDDAPLLEAQEAPDLDEQAEAAPPAKRQLTPKQKVLLARRARQKRLAQEAAATSEPAQLEEDAVAPPPMALEAAAENIDPVNTEIVDGPIAADIEEQLKTTGDTKDHGNPVNRNLEKLKAKYGRPAEGKSFPLIPLLIGAAALLVALLAWVFFTGNTETTSEIPATNGETSQTGSQSTDPSPPSTGNPQSAIDTGTPIAGTSAEEQYQRWKAMSARATSSEDEARALQILKRAAARNFPPAQFALGEIYYTGDGGPANTQLARQWIQAAAEGGNVNAMHKLGSMYASGDGGQQDIFTALSWFEQAATHGRVNSIYNLALIYDPSTELEGISASVTDAGNAYYWYALAEKLGDADATADADRMGQLITLEKRREQDARVAAWVAAPPIASANQQ